MSTFSFDHSSDQIVAERCTATVFVSASRCRSLHLTVPICHLECLQVRYEVPAAVGDTDAATLTDKCPHLVSWATLAVLLCWSLLLTRVQGLVPGWLLLCMQGWDLQRVCFTCEPTGQSCGCGCKIGTSSALTT